MFLTSVTLRNWRNVQLHFIFIHSGILAANENNPPKAFLFIRLASNRVQYITNAVQALFFFVQLPGWSQVDFLPRQRSLAAERVYHINRIEMNAMKKIFYNYWHQCFYFWTGVSTNEQGTLQILSLLVSLWHFLTFLIINYLYSVHKCFAWFENLLEASSFRH